MRRLHSTRGRKKVDIEAATIDTTEDPMAHEASITTSRESPLTAIEIAYALAPIGAALLAVAWFVHEVILINQSPDARLWAAGSLVAYVAIWQWALTLARS